MGYLGFGEIESGTTGWGATESQIKRDIIDTLVQDCIEKEYRATGHRHNKVYCGYGDDTVLLSDTDEVVLGVSTGSDIAIQINDSSGTLRIVSKPSNDVFLEIDPSSNTIDIGSGTTTVNVNGVPI